ncbi:YolD-like protein [compost metagenome]
MLRAAHEEKRKTRPLFDEQYTEEIGRALSDAHRAKQPVNIRMFDEFDDVHVIGVIERLDAQGRRFMVDGEWFRLDNILEMGFATKE